MYFQLCVTKVQVAYLGIELRIFALPGQCPNLAPWSEYSAGTAEVLDLIIRFDLLFFSLIFRLRVISIILMSKYSLKMTQ